MDILEILRMVFGSIFVIFVPGFAWSFVFFAGKNLDWIERVAISVGLSIAIVTLGIFCLNLLFNIKITLLNVSLIVCVLILIPGIYITSKKLIKRKHIADKVK